MGRQHLSAYVNVSFSGVRSAALCPTLSCPGKAPSLCTWGRVFCSSTVFPGLKMFFCYLEPRFMAKGMDAWVTGTGSLRVLVENIVVSQLKIVCSGKNVKEIWNWYSVVDGTWSLRERDLNLLWLWEGVQAVWDWGYIQSYLHGCQLRKPWDPRLEWWIYLSMHHLSWLSATTTRACPCFSGAWLKSSLCVWCAAAMCAITFGCMGESLGAQGYEKGWHSLSAKQFWHAVVMEEVRTVLKLWCLPGKSVIADKCVFARSE